MLPASATPGALDPSFVNGSITLPVSIAFAPWGMVVDDQGRVVVFGDSFLSLLGYTPAAVRILPSGALDATFGKNGLVEVEINDRAAHATVAAIDAHGRILIGGRGVTVARTSAAMVMRLTTTGALDPTFGDAGVVLFHEDQDFPSVRAIATDARGVYVASETTVDRLRDDGSIDPTFAAYAIGGVTALAPYADGVFVASGSRVSAVDPSGAAHATFGAAGTVTLTPRGDDLSVMTLFPAPSGRVVAGGSGYSFVSFVALAADGMFDPLFASGGEWRSGVDVYPSDFAQLCDGRYMIGGTTSANFALARALENGARDPSYPATGVRSTPADADAGFRSGATSVVDSSTGKVTFVASTSGRTIRMVRVQP